jgi:hypothetical protein
MAIRARSSTIFSVDQRYVEGRALSLWPSRTVLVLLLSVGL